MATQMQRIGDFLTKEDIIKAVDLYSTNRRNFHSLCKEKIILPNLDRINESLGQENNPDYLAYAVEAALSQIPSS